MSTRATPRFVRVLPDLTGLDREFDYLVPPDVVGRAGFVGVGSIVRVPLNGRRVRGWITQLDPDDGPVAPDRLTAITALSSRGPAPALVELARWASVRWAAGRLRPFLVTASPPANVTVLPAPRRRGSGPASLPDAARAVGEATAILRNGDGGMLLVPPATSPIGAIEVAASGGPTLVVMPSVVRARIMGTALARRGWAVAVVPQQWAAAEAGVDIVIGARAAAWAPCPDLRAVVVIDEHDDSMQEERSPTWHARDVVVERARRIGAPVIATSPCPTASGVAAVGGAVSRLAVDAERAGWPIVDVVDRSGEEPWRTSLVTSPLITALRQPDATVVCVHNTPGRARILACRACSALVRCERCDAAVALDDDGQLVCHRCTMARPPVCQVCGASSFSNLRPGVTRLREELEAAAGRPVVAVTGADRDPPTESGVYVGTEAVLHRVTRADVVAILDIDTELLAPRYRAAEQAMALITRAARLLGPRSQGGRLLLQTFVPDHDVIRAAVLADPGRLLEPELERRRMLALPPFSALARVGGPGRDDVIEWLRTDDRVSVADSGSAALVRAGDWNDLGHALVAASQHPGRDRSRRVRFEVDPARV